jgi:hypothetical protein
MAKATKDVSKLAEVGAQLLERDLADQVTGKKAEIQQLKKVAKSVEKLASDSDVKYPTEVEYLHTARSGVGGLVTKTAILTLNDASEALDAAATLEKRMDGFTKLRDQMLLDLQQRQRQLKVMKQGLSDFVESSSRVLGELLTMAT